MNNQEKGLLYEKYVKDFIIQKIGKNAYLWNECPENILIENALIDSHNDMRLLRKDIKEGYLHCHKDIGIDIIQLDNDKCSIGQCKNGYNNGLCVDDISGIMMRSNFLRDINTFIYYTNCLSRNIRYTAKLSSYVIDIDCSTNIDKLLEVHNDNKIYFVKLPYEDKNNQEIIKTEIIPYSYQTDAVAKFKEHFESNNRGVLSLPCGCGKTYTSYMISSDYSHIIILSPLREFASQNLNRFIEYGYDETNTLLVDSDGNRDIDSIKDIIRNKNKLLISCTYNSMDLITECLDLFQNALFIVDEFHNLSKANISDDENNIFKLLMSDHKILFMSATPRIYYIEYDDEAFDMEWLFGDVVYQMTFTDAITNRFITDYKIWLPSIHENNEELDKELSIYEIDNIIKNRCKFLYSCIANNGSRKCIVYCKDTEDMKSMMECMKTLNEFYIMDIVMNSISCEDSEKKRKSILESFTINNDKIQLLFNIRILNECIDIPSCDSIYISYAPKNKITTIQRISRATRTDKSNPYKIANIYIWCEEYEEILETLSSIKEYDIMFKDKIKVNAVDFYHSKEDKEIELVDNDKVLLSNCIVGVKEFRVMSWEQKLEMVEEYIKGCGKLPCSKNKDRYISSLGHFLANHIHYYRSRTNKMVQNYYYELFTEFTTKYQDLFLSNTEIWYDNFKEVKKYIDVFKRRPSLNDENIPIAKLARWINTQQNTFKKDTKVFKNADIKSEWYRFLEEYRQYFLTEEDKWNENLMKVMQYIQKHKKKPSSHSDDKDIQYLSRWIQSQQNNYKAKKFIMANNEIYNLWSKFIKDYEEYLKSNEDIWYDNLNKLKDYINCNKKRPNSSDKGKEIQSIAKWLVQQNRDFKSKTNIMKIQRIFDTWFNFIQEYKEYLKSNEDIWYDSLDKVKEYIDINHKRPSCSDKNPDIKSLGLWCVCQQKNYRDKINAMKNEDICIKWNLFIEDYQDYFISDDDKWYSNLSKIKEYINIHKKRPSEHNEECKYLSNWLLSQIENYKNKNKSMNNKNIYNEFKLFLEEYNEYFRSNEETWFEKFEKLKNYMDMNKKRPSEVDKDYEIAFLGKWLSRQLKNYKQKEQIMKYNPIIYNEWNKFMNEYCEYFTSKCDIWRNNLLIVIKYIEGHNKLPSSKDLDDKGCWLSDQKKNYENNKYIMKDPEIRQQWEEFIAKYPHLF
jgi:superfamily II DNA or RNA helicase